MATIYYRLAVLAHRGIAFHIDPLWSMATIYSRFAVLAHRGITFHYQSSLVNGNNLLQTCGIGTEA